MEKQKTLKEIDAKFNWHNYNLSQTREKGIFLHLLNEITYSTLQEIKARKIFCMCLKTYLNISSRRMISDLVMCKRMGFVGRVPCFNSILNYFNDPTLTKTLQYLIELSSLPVSNLERKFAVDSSGISLHQYEPWKSIRTRHKEHRKYKKMHCIYGVLTNIITSCIITNGVANDSPKFRELLERTAANFKVEEVSADMAYSSRENLKLAHELGAIPFIPFRKNTSGRRAGGCTIWRTMYNYFKNRQEEFLKHYHKRSNAETGFFMIKTKFGEFVRCKNDVAQTNEILCKILCHNLCVLIQELFLSDIEINFQKIYQNSFCTISD